MKIAIFSDQHLLRGPSEKKSALLKILLALRSQCDELWLLGDVFDILIGPFNFWQIEHSDFFAELKQWTLAGKKVLWIEGNHDFHIKAQLDKVGVTHSVEEVTRLLPGPDGQELKVYLAHGDLVDLEDTAYLKWRAFIRHPLFKRSLSACPEFVAKQWLLPMAERVSAHSRQRDTPKDLPHVKECFRLFAQEKFVLGYSAVFLGHSHVHDYLVQDNKFYLNLGSWYEKSLRYAVWDTRSGRNPEILVYN